MPAPIAYDGLVALVASVDFGYCQSYSDRPAKTAKSAFGCTVETLD